MRDEFGVVDVSREGDDLAWADLIDVDPVRDHDVADLQLRHHRSRPLYHRPVYEHREELTFEDHHRHHAHRRNLEHGREPLTERTAPFAAGAPRRARLEANGTIGARPVAPAAASPPTHAARSLGSNSRATPTSVRSPSASATPAARPPRFILLPVANATVTATCVSRPSVPGVPASARLEGDASSVHAGCPSIVAGGLIRVLEQLVRSSAARCKCVDC